MRASRVVWTFTQDSPSPLDPPPLYFLLIWLVRHAGESEWWLRAPSAAFSVLAVAATYCLGRSALGRFQGLVGSALLAIGLLSVQMGQEARDFALGMLLMTLATYLVRRLRQQFAWASVVALSGVTALAIYTTYWSMFAVGGLLAFVGCTGVFFFVRRPHGWAGGVGRSAAILVAVAVGLASWIPWLPQVARFLRAGAERSQPAPSVAEAFRATQWILGEALAVNDLGVWVLLGLAGYALVPRHRGQAARLVIAAPLGLFLVYLVARPGGIYPRYVSHFTPLLYLLVADGIARMAGDGRAMLRPGAPHARAAQMSSRPSVARWVIAAVVVALHIPATLDYVRQPPVRAGWKEAAGYIAAHMSSGDV